MGLMQLPTSPTCPDLGEFCGRTTSCCDQVDHVNAPARLKTTGLGEKRNLARDAAVERRRHMYLVIYATYRSVILGASVDGVNVKVFI